MKIHQYPNHSAFALKRRPIDREQYLQRILKNQHVPTGNIEHECKSHFVLQQGSHFIPTHSFTS